jgi:hypothetical protein
VLDEGIVRKNLLDAVDIEQYRTAAQGAGTNQYSHMMAGREGYAAGERAICGYTPGSCWVDRRRSLSRGIWDCSFGFWTWHSQRNSHNAGAHVFGEDIEASNLVV